MSTAIDIKGLNVYFGDSHNLFHAVKSATFAVESGAALSRSIIAARSMPLPATVA